MWQGRVAARGERCGCVGARVGVFLRGLGPVVSPGGVPGPLRSPGRALRALTPVGADAVVSGRGPPLRSGPLSSVVRTGQSLRDGPRRYAPPDFSAGRSAPSCWPSGPVPSLRAVPSSLRDAVRRFPLTLRVRGRGHHRPQPPQGRGSTDQCRLMNL